MAKHWDSFLSNCTSGQLPWLKPNTTSTRTSMESSYKIWSHSELNWLTCEPEDFFFFFELAFIVLSVSYQTYIERNSTGAVGYSLMISSEWCVIRRREVKGVRWKEKFYEAEPDHHSALTNQEGSGQGGRGRRSQLVARWKLPSLMPPSKVPKT